MLSGKEKRYLRSVASTRNALIIVGKEGIKSTLIKTLRDALDSHELVKVSLLKTYEEPLKETAFDLAGATGSEVVQTIGRTCVLYKRSKKNLMEL